MTFFQVLITNEHKSSFDRMYTGVYNYPTLEQAFRVYQSFWANMPYGVTFEESMTGREMCQQELRYSENGGQVFELRNEYVGEIDGIKQFATQKQVFIKEVII